ncbi:type VI secretion system tube protein TssD [Xanthovirga aplysinae]|uniref:type VI secretion system tube protein TssD n=1 Tax=Xanthovirga aplysinae TaxID=2529853 RepID=UPI0012BBEECC|nr:type VI secretion system tube protein TssD [Xanthovirga aplysinae]MTI31958.1 hypothetical protein [Xanthovirga aplysinae]
MAVKAKLFIDELELNLLEYDLEFIQPVGFQSRPNDSVKGGIFNVAFEKQENVNYLMNWMTQANMRKNGKIRFYTPDGMGRLYEQEFWDAYCITYKETFWADSPEPMTIRLSFAAGIIRNSKGALFQQTWKISDIGAMAEQSQPEEEEEKEGQVKSVAITDLEGVDKEKLKAGEQVLLVVETKDLAGKTININLSQEENVSFKYQGNLIADDVLRDYAVQSEKDEIELEVVEREAQGG